MARTAMVVPVAAIVAAMVGAAVTGPPADGAARYNMGVITTKSVEDFFSAVEGAAKNLETPHHVTTVFESGDNGATDEGGDARVQPVLARHLSQLEFAPADPGVVAALAKAGAEGVEHVLVGGHLSAYPGR